MGKAYENPEVRKYMDRYLQGDARFPVENRIKAIAKRSQVIPTDHPDYQQSLTSPWTMPDSLLKAGK
ncbi:MAG: hypothetical protein AB1585_08930 [Thermodesulfobacteriota bacterium]